MKILVIGSGGRDHALSWKLKQSPRLSELHCAPGNAGIANIATCHNVAVDDISGLVKLSQDLSIDFVVVGPELPLTLGIVDALNAAGIKSFGPNKAAAILEGSKGFMKDLCAKNNIPTAAYERFSDIDAAIGFIDNFAGNVVIKADGLAAGKGVIIPSNKDEAKQAARDMLSGDEFGDAGTQIVIEEFMEGQEMSFFALTDGIDVIPFGTAEDHKRAHDNDQGLNTGGMGAYGPSPLADQDMQDRIMAEIIRPTVQGLRDQGITYTGVLYAGLMITPDGQPKLIEYNVRFGDPECQVLMMQLQSDLLDILLAIADQTLSSIADTITWSPKMGMTVVAASKGYPEAYRKNTVIRNLDQIAETEDFTVFHAGTARNAANQLVSSGGRVLNFTGLADNMESLRNLVYSNLEKMSWPEGFYRRDIGVRNRHKLPKIAVSR